MFHVFVVFGEHTHTHIYIYIYKHQQDPFEQSLREAAGCCDGAGPCCDGYESQSDASPQQLTTDMFGWSPTTPSAAATSEWPTNKIEVESPPLRPFALVLMQMQHCMPRTLLKRIPGCLKHLVDWLGPKPKLATLCAGADLTLPAFDICRAC